MTKPFVVRETEIDDYTLVSPYVDDATKWTIKTSTDLGLITPNPPQKGVIPGVVATFTNPLFAMYPALGVALEASGFVFQGGGLLLGCASLLVGACAHIKKTRGLHRIHAAAGEHYIRTEWLTPEAVHLARRAKAACDTALGTQVVRDGKLDGQISVEFPALVWDIAKILLDVSQIQAEIATTNNPTLERKILREALDKVTGRMAARVAAMESCAANVAEADRRYRAMLPADQGGNIDSRILNLMISTQSEGSEQVESITQDAQIVAESYRQAMDTALDSLNTLLEPR